MTSRNLYYFVIEPNSKHSDIMGQGFKHMNVMVWGGHESVLSKQIR